MYSDFTVMVTNLKLFLLFNIMKRMLFVSLPQLIVIHICWWVLISRVFQLHNITLWQRCHLVYWCVREIAASLTADSSCPVHWLWRCSQNMWLLLWVQKAGIQRTSLVLSVGWCSQPSWGWGGRCYVMRQNLCLAGQWALVSPAQFPRCSAVQRAAGGPWLRSGPALFWWNVMFNMQTF